MIPIGDVATWASVALAAIGAIVSVFVWAFRKFGALRRSGMAEVRARLETEGRRLILAVENQGPAEAVRLRVTVDGAALEAHPIFGPRADRALLDRLGPGEVRRFRGVDFDHGRRTLEVVVHWTTAKRREGYSRAVLDCA